MQDGFLTQVFVLLNNRQKLEMGILQLQIHKDRTVIAQMNPV